MGFKLEEMRQGVAGLIREVAREVILPLHRNLQDGDIRFKGTNDPVTTADLEAERLLTAGLMARWPGAGVIGEEAAHEDPSILDLLTGDRPVWIIDPVDGTGNFTRGSDVFAVIVALVERGRAEAGWIYAPATDEMLVGERGIGVDLNGAPLGDTIVKQPGEMRGAVHLRYLPADMRAVVKDRLGRFAGNREFYCAGQTYLRLATGEIDHCLFGRAKPWDHAAGALILEELGGRTAFIDETDYRADLLGRKGLLGVRARAAWPATRDVLFPDRPPVT